LRVIRIIFAENWDNFKDRYPAYDSGDQYEESVQKMLNCSKEFGGYCEYICMKCGRDLRRVVLAVKVAFVFRAQKSMLIIIW
jgi:hypothetical protein